MPVKATPQAHGIDPAGAELSQLRLQGLPPIVSPHTVVLVLGSFPGVASLRARQYYGHPQNQFWRVLQALWPQHPLPEGHTAYEERCAWLLQRRLGVWDVYASCTREGSLDASIRGARLNDFAALSRQCPALRAVAHNGAESFRHEALVRAQLQAQDFPSRADGMESIKLPSTSAANAGWSFERKLLAWAALMARHGLL